MNVDLIDHMGSDLTVVNSARVSFDKESKWVQCEGSDGRDRGLSGEDKKLISYLAKHNHWSPFSHCFAQFRITAPIFVARQLQKHTVGLAWNEVSRRYVDNKPSFYEPDAWRKRAQNVKQGSSDETLKGEPFYEYIIDGVSHVITLSHWHFLAQQFYDKLVNYPLYNISPEQARMILPQTMYTEWFWSGSLYAFARVCKQRLDPHAQAETRWFAEQISAHMQTLFPESWKALLNG